MTHHRFTIFAFYSPRLRDYLAVRLRYILDVRVLDMGMSNYRTPPCSVSGHALEYSEMMRLEVDTERWSSLVDVMHRLSPAAWKVVTLIARDDLMREAKNLVPSVRSAAMWPTLLDLI
jgi:hypothetical protein